MGVGALGHEAAEACLLFLRPINQFKHLHVLLRPEKDLYLREVQIRLECFFTVLVRLLLKTLVNWVENAHRVADLTFHEEHGVANRVLPRELDSIEVAVAVYACQAPGMCAAEKV